jgi:predicted PurR-regulated permease PerM
VTLKAVADKPQDPQPVAGDRQSTILNPQSSADDPQSAIYNPQSAIHNPQSEAPLSIRMPVDIRSAALTILAGLALILVLQYAQAMIIPIVLAVLISYALEPMVAWLVRRRLPRGLAAAVVLVALVATGGWMLYSLRSQAAAFVDQLPQAATRLRRMMENDRPTAATAIQQVQKAATELEKAANAASPPPAPSGVQRVLVETAPINISDYVLWGSIGIVAAIGQLVLILFLVYFLLSSGDLYRRKLVKIIGTSLSEKKVTVQILQEIDRQIEMFLLVEVFTSVIVGVATWLAFLALGVEQAAVWGVLAGIFNSIPYFGPVIVTGATSLVAFLQFGNLRMAILVGAVSLAITSLEGFLLTPWLTSRATRMNAVAIFVGLLFWGWVWNVWGMLLAVPMLMVMKAVCDHVEDFKGIGELLGD